MSGVSYQGVDKELGTTCLPSTAGTLNDPELTARRIDGRLNQSLNGLALGVVLEDPSAEVCRSEVARDTNSLVNLTRSATCHNPSPRAESST